MTKLGLMCAAAYLVTASHALATITFTDGVFANVQWSLAATQNTGTVNTAPQGFQVPSGGAPAEFRRINHNSFTNIIVTHHVNSLAAYDPGASGAIGSIAFSADLLAILSHANINVGISLLVVQNGQYYYTPAQAGPGVGGYFLNNTLNTWVGFSTTLIAADFARFGNPAAHPDFSASGAPIQFGFSAFNDNAGFNTSRAVGVDNWSMTINPVPAPGLAVVVPVAASIRAFRRSRRAIQP